MRPALVCVAVAGCGRIFFDPRAIDAASGFDSAADSSTDARFGPPPGHVLSLDGSGYAVADSLCTAISTELTMSGWVYPAATQLPGNPMLFAFNNAVGANPENESLTIWDPTMMRVDYFDDVFTTSAVTGPQLTPPQWVFAAVTIDAAGQGTMYQNGVVVQTFTTPRVIPSNGRFSIGQEWDASSVTDTFTGAIDEVRIWNVARTQAELLDEMATPPAPDAPNLVGYYTFESGMQDASGHGHDGALQGTATISATP